MRVESLKILQTNAPPWRWSLCNRLWRLFSFENSQEQASWWFSITTSLHALIERSIIEFCYGITGFHQLKRWYLQLDPSQRWLTYKDDILWVNQGYYWCSWPCTAYPRCGSMIPRLAQLNREWLWLGFHSKIMVIAMLLPWDQVKAFHCFPNSN